MSPSLSLPSYRPDLNPIAPMLAKLKAPRRKAAARAREARRRTTGHPLEAFGPAECRTYLETSGYAFDETENALGPRQPRKAHASHPENGA